VSTFDPKKFGWRLRHEREMLGFSQAEMARRSREVSSNSKTGVSKPYWSMLERGDQENRPSDEYLARISRAFNHQDLWIVREWAGMEREPDNDSVLRALVRDKNLAPTDRALFKEIYLRLAGRKSSKAEGTEKEGAP